MPIVLWQDNIVIKKHFVANTSYARFGIKQTLFSYPDTLQKRGKTFSERKEKKNVFWHEHLSLVISAKESTQPSNMLAQNGQQYEGKNKPPVPEPPRAEIFLLPGHQ